MTIDINYFKKKLTNEKSLLEEELKSVGTPKKENPADWDEREEKNEETADANVSADFQEDTEERHALTNELEKRYQEINKALEQMGKGKYGVCEVCGQPIEEERLEANPAAPTCKKHLS